jgi:hypothetical protein
LQQFEKLSFALKFNIFGNFFWPKMEWNTLYFNLS